MSRGPDFDELVGREATGEERERLRRTHELLLAAGPPPELSPELEAGPTLALTLGRRRRGHHRRRVALLLAASIAVALVFLGGYIAGNRGGSATPSGSRVIQLRGTSAAPNALASLRLDPEDVAGNWPMTLNVTGLPKLSGEASYAVYLVRNGKPYAPCGSFLVAGTHNGVTVTLNDPYEYQRGDTWIVTRQASGQSGPGQAVLRPVA
jgi:hypothetical protein